MSKYTGSITIVDDQGNSVFERELGSDELIDVLLERVDQYEKDPMGDGIVIDTHNIASMIEEAKKFAPPKETKAQAEKRVMGDPAFTRNKAKECCGSKGARHFKWCKEMGGTGNPTLIATADGRMPFSESTYNEVRKMYSDGLSTDMIVAEKGFDIEECRKIRLSSTYDAYRRMK